MARPGTLNRPPAKRLEVDITYIDYVGDVSQLDSTIAGPSLPSSQSLPDFSSSSPWPPSPVQPQPIHQPPTPGFVVEIPDGAASANWYLTTTPSGEDCLLLPCLFPSHISDPAFPPLSRLSVKLWTFMRRYASQQALLP
jgi:hypothetical protein